jgi:hypothetical protein
MISNREFEMWDVRYVMQDVELVKLAQLAKQTKHTESIEYQVLDVSVRHLGCSFCFFSLTPET